MEKFKFLLTNHYSLIYEVDAKNINEAYKNALDFAGDINNWADLIDSSFDYCNSEVTAHGELPESDDEDEDDGPVNTITVKLLEEDGQCELNLGEPDGRN